MRFIQEFKQVSDGPHPSKFCFVLGAGASKSSGIKTGITEENKYSYYSQYYEKRYTQYHKSLSITLRTQGKREEVDLEKQKAEKLGLK